jgi:uncharacterized protein (DUF1800 family)
MFFDASVRMNRAKLPVEWVTAAFAAAGASNGGWQASVADNLGQLPFFPPSVAGWPGGTRWLAASNALARAGLAHDGPVLAEITNAADQVGTALVRCSVYELSPATRASLDAVAALTIPKWQRSRLLLALILCTPEFVLA